MPSAYTASVADGTITDLKPFAIQLARGMGALIMMRDDPWDAPIPEKFEPSQYNAGQLAEAKTERDRVLAMTGAEAETAAKAEAAEHDALIANRKAERTEQRARYQAMIEKVEAWDGAPEGIKEFGLSQLRESMEFDCAEQFTWYKDRPSEDGEVWRAAKLTEIERSMAYHAKAQTEEEARVEARNAWLAQLRKSLGEG